MTERLHDQCSRSWQQVLARVSLVMAVIAFAILAALAPESAAAADRGMPRGDDWLMIVWVTSGALVALFALTAIGYLYRRERGLDWEFQKPDAPHDEHH